MSDIDLSQDFDGASAAGLLAVGSVVWSVEQAAYIDLFTGQVIAQQVVLDVLSERMAEGLARMNGMLDAVLAGSGGMEELQTSLVAELRRAHTQAAALGKGGWDAMTPQDWGRVGFRLRTEYSFLRDFMRDVFDGKLSLAQIQNRLRQYANHLQMSFWEANRSTHAETGFTEEARQTTPADHCDDCLGYEAQGFVPLGTLPPPGVGSVCQSECHCLFVFR